MGARLMAVEVGGITLTFEVLLVCPRCEYRELPAELTDRPSADLKVEESRDGEVVTFRCYGCGRRRYLDEAISIRDLRRVPPKAGPIEPEEAT